MTNTNIAWLRGEVSDSDYPGLLFTQTIALRDDYYPENDSGFTDNTKRAIGDCQKNGGTGLA
jgi:hypothetical protein